MQIRKRNWSYNQRLQNQFMEMSLCKRGFAENYLSAKETLRLPDVEVVFSSFRI